MTTTLDHEVAPSAAGVTPRAGTPRTTRLVASGLWVFVAGLLAYGIVQTAIKAAALFG